MNTQTNKTQYPHHGGCKHCRQQNRCNVCGRNFAQLQSAIIMGRCTNGRCSECHPVVCTAAGDTSPGHGFGTREAAMRQFEYVTGKRLTR